MFQQLLIRTAAVLMTAETRTPPPSPTSIIVDERVLVARPLMAVALHLGPVYPRRTACSNHVAAAWSERRCRLLITRWLLKRAAQTL